MSIEWCVQQLKAHPIAHTSNILGVPHVFGVFPHFRCRMTLSPKASDLVQWIEYRGFSSIRCLDLMHKLVLDLKNCWYWKKTSRKYLVGLTPTILLLLHSPKRWSLGDNLLTLADSFPVMALSVVDCIASAQCHGDCATDVDPNWTVRGIGTIEFEVHPTVDTSICKSEMCNNLPYVATQGMSLSSFEILTYIYTIAHKSSVA